jgi:hypothetical protein
LHPAIFTNKNCYGGYGVGKKHEDDQMDIPWAGNSVFACFSLFADNSIKRLKFIHHKNDL